MSPHPSLRLFSLLSPTQNEQPAQTCAEAAMCDGPKDLRRSKRNTELAHVHRFYMCTGCSWANTELHRNKTQRHTDSHLSLMQSGLNDLERETEWLSVAADGLFDSLRCQKIHGVNNSPTNTQTDQRDRLQIIFFRGVFSGWGDESSCLQTLCTTGSLTLPPSGHPSRSVSSLQKDLPFVFIINDSKTSL